MYKAALNEDPIAALATPLGTSALAVIRCSGNGCIELLAGGFSRPKALRSSLGHQLLVGSLRDPASKKTLDEVVLAIFRAPRSYTGEDMVEISCHGSPLGVEAVMGLLLGLGFRQAIGGEFTMRAFLNGKLDLTQAEAVHELVSSQSKSARNHALERLGGAVRERIDTVKQGLIRLMAVVSVQLDYPEDEIDPLEFPLDALDRARVELKALATSWSLGRLYHDGVRVALAGKTNAGKSSLFNALVREERAIVSDVHGTTRDWLEVRFVVDGIPVRLYDTAGIRQSSDQVEAEGIRRTLDVVGGSPVLLYVVDGCRGLAEDDRANIAKFAQDGSQIVLLWNKSDAPGWLPPPPDTTLTDSTPSNPIRPDGALMPGVAALLTLSAKTYEGIELLLATLGRLIRGERQAEDAGYVIESERQHRLLLRALEALDQVASGFDQRMSLDLIALDLQEALRALGEITGEVSSEDILDAVFSGFCVGK